MPKLQIWNVQRLDYFGFHAGYMLKASTTSREEAELQASLFGREQIKINRFRFNHSMPMTEDTFQVVEVNFWRLA
jgi:hypothetical protein